MMEISSRTTKACAFICSAQVKRWSCRRKRRCRSHSKTSRRWWTRLSLGRTLCPARDLSACQHCDRSRHKPASWPFTSSLHRHAATLRSRVARESSPLSPRLRIIATVIEAFTKTQQLLQLQQQFRLSFTLPFMLHWKTTAKISSAVTTSTNCYGQRCRDCDE